MYLIEGGSGVGGEGKLQTLGICTCTCTCTFLVHTIKLVLVTESRASSDGAHCDEYNFLDSVLKI